MSRSRSSSRWLAEHFTDPYVKQAQQLGYRSRAVFKLRELDEKDHLFKPGMTIVDLGAAPGGWSQYAIERIGKMGRVVALDILEMEPLDRVTFIQGDFRDEDILEHLQYFLNGTPVQLLLSDMAPNTSGMREVDQPRAMYLAELAMDTAQKLLARQGTMVVKLFHGEGFDDYCRQARKLFAKVVMRKPRASRDRSPEVYMIAKNYLAGN